MSWCSMADPVHCGLVLFNCFHKQWHHVTLFIVCAATCTWKLELTEVSFLPLCVSCPVIEPGFQSWLQAPLPVKLFFFFFFFLFWDRVSLCSPDCPGTHSVDQAGLKLRNLPASASQVLGLKVCATMPSCYPYRSLFPEENSSSITYGFPMAF